MRKKNNEILNFINKEVENDISNWQNTRGANFGIPLQKLVSKYFKENKWKFGIDSIISNTNPNNPDPDIQLIYNNGVKKGIEVKSCKNGQLSGVTICNAPHLINDTDVILINYGFVNDYLNVIDVVETQIFRLITINNQGKYAGCLSSTRDTGKKIKGRNYNNFIITNDEDDYSLDELREPSLIRRTILYYSASKLVDKNYLFTDEEILEAIRKLRG